MRLGMLRTHKHDTALNPDCKEGRKRSALLIPGPSQCFWVRPPFSPLDSLRVLPDANDHHKPGKKLLPRSAILPHNIRIHNIIAFIGSGNNGKVFKLNLFKGPNVCLMLDGHNGSADSKTV